MSPEIEQAKSEIAATRAQLSATADELKATVSQKVDRAKQTVSPAHYAREFPWAALGLAIGAGLAIGLTGADKKAATAAVDGAKSAGAALADAAVAAKDAVVEKISGSEDNESASVTATAPDDGNDPGLRDRTFGAIHELLEHGLDEILSSLGVSRDEVRRRVIS